MTTRLRDLIAVLRHREFKLLWTATTLSVLGDRIVTVALALFVTDLTGSATDLGLVLAARSLPLVGFVLIGGVWADRLQRHRVVVVTDLARFSLHGLLAALIIAGTVEIWQVIAIEIAFGTAEAFFRPAASGLLPQTVPESEIQEANALIAMSNNVGEFVGPALATVLVLGIGAGAAFALDAATFLASAALIIRMRPRRRELAEPALAGAAAGWRSELRDGFREVRSRTWVWATLAAFCVAVFVGFGPWYVLGPSVAEEQYGGIGVYGAVAAVLGVGTIIGSLIAIRWRPLHPMRMAMIGVCLVPLSQIVYAVGVTEALMYPSQLVAGVGVALFDVWWLTALAERIPPDKLSRVDSYDWMVSLGLVPLGYLLAGPLAETLGAVAVLIAGSAVAFVALAAALLPRETWNLRRIDEPLTPVDLSEPHPARPG
jgi:MFS family permease